MRLIHIPDMVIRDFPGSNTPDYAILSHTWGDEEVSFSQFNSSDKATLLENRKIAGCCNQAAMDGLDYVWIDTCCIDKTSSAELSEAINSMYKWYRDAAICYAYLEDVDASKAPKGTPVGETESFSKSRWFTRGWTLQELLAPYNVLFYDAHWKSIGTRTELAESIARTTRIHLDALLNGMYGTYSVAQRMSWAANRNTTREEDQAYCLLGLFGINMPLLYGEGPKAFLRLQQEIMKGSDDHSLFAWDASTDIRRELERDGVDGPWHPYNSLFAPSPRQFICSGEIWQCKNRDNAVPYAITNRGVQISLPILAADNIEANPSYPEISYMFYERGPPSLAILNCEPPDSKSRCAIYLEWDNRVHSYIRVNVDLPLVFVPCKEIDKRGELTDLLIQSTDQLDHEEVTKPRGLLVQPPVMLLERGFIISRIWPHGWNWKGRDSRTRIVEDEDFAYDLGLRRHSMIVEYRSTWRGDDAFLLALKRELPSAHVQAVVVPGTRLPVIEEESEDHYVSSVMHYVSSVMNSIDRSVAGNETLQRCGGEVLSLVPKVTDARHATIVSIEVSIPSPSH